MADWLLDGDESFRRVRETVRRTLDGVSGSGAYEEPRPAVLGGSSADVFVMHEEADTLTNTALASKLKEATRDTIQIVFTGLVDATRQAPPFDSYSNDLWRIQYGGFYTDFLNVDAPASKVKQELELLPAIGSGDAIVTAFPGRYLIQLFDSDPEFDPPPPSAYGLIAESDDFDLYQQPVYFQRDETVEVGALHLEQDAKIHAGNFVLGFQVLGSVRVIDECRTFELFGSSAPPDPDNDPGEQPGGV